MKLNNLKIAPKLGILVGVTLLGLCAAGVLAGYLMQREMLNARIEQTKAIVDMAPQHGGRAEEAGRCRPDDQGGRDGRIRASAATRMTYDKGAGYLFGTGYDGITLLAPDPKQIGTNRMEVVTNGRKLSHELMDGVEANGSILLRYEYAKPGQETPIRKIGYAVAVPGLDMYLGTGAYLDDLDAKMRPIAWLLGLAILGIAIIAGSVAWMIGRSICVRSACSAPACRISPTASSTARFPGVGRGDEVGAMAATVQIFKDNAVRIRELEKAEAETQARAAAERRAAMESIASDFERSVNGIVRSVSSAAAGHADHRAVDDRDRQRRQRAGRDRRRRLAELRRTMSARLPPPPKSCRARSPRFRARSPAPARSRARRSATPSAPMPPCRCSRPAPRRSARS